MIALRSCLVVSALVGLAGCGDDTESSDSAGGSASGTNSTTSDVEPTTGGSTGGESTGAPFDPCDCDAPVVHDGHLGIADLAAYQGACLVEVAGAVELVGIEDPSQLTALSHLRRARSLQIGESPGLVDLAPLSCLQEVEFLWLYHNPNLIDLGALARVEVAERIHFNGMPIEAMPGFAPGYQGVRTLALFDLPELRDLDAIAGWPGLHSVESLHELFSVSFSNLPKLESIAGLAGPVGSAVAKSSLDSASGGWVSVELGELPALATLDGLETLTHANLTLQRLPSIKELSPLANLERVGRLTLSGLKGITSLSGLSSLTQAWRVILSGCEEGETMSSLASLSGIDSLAEIGSELWIVDAPVLADLAAPALTTIERVYFVDTPALDDAAIAAFTAQAKATYACAGGIVECSCIGLIPDGVTHGCSGAWSGGSAVAGASEGGPFDGVTAFFGWIGDNIGFSGLTLVLLDATSDIEAAKQDGLWAADLGRPKAILETGRYYEWWIEKSPSPVVLYDAGGGLSMGTVELDVQGRLGDWQTFDPADPPRLHGVIKSSDPNAAVVLDGPFEAAFCDDFTLFLSD